MRGFFRAVEQIVAFRSAKRAFRICTGETAGQATFGDQSASRRQHHQSSQEHQSGQQDDEAEAAAAVIFCVVVVAHGRGAAVQQEYEVHGWGQQGPQPDAAVAEMFQAGSEGPDLQCEQDEMCDCKEQECRQRHGHSQHDERDQLHEQQSGEGEAEQPAPH